MTNEAVAFVLIIAIFAFSLWLSSGIKLLLQKIERLEAVINLLKHRQESSEVG